MCQLCGFGGMKVPSVLVDNVFARFPKSFWSSCIVRVCGFVAMSFLRISGILPHVPSPKTITITLFEGMFSLIFFSFLSANPTFCYFITSYMHKDKYTRRAHILQTWCILVLLGRVEFPIL